MRVNLLEVRTVVWLFGREFDILRSGDGCCQGLRVEQGMDRVTRSREDKGWHLYRCRVCQAGTGLPARQVLQMRKRSFPERRLRDYATQLAQ